MKRPSGGSGWKLGRRASIGVADQVLSSLTNFALNLLVVRSVTTEAYGAFALAYVLYNVFRGVLHAFVAQPLLVRHTEAPAAKSRAEEPAHRTYELALGGGLGFGLVGGGVLLVGAVFTSGGLSAALLVLALLLPGLMAQEVMRAVYFARGRPSAALAIDAAWAVTQLVLVGGVLATGNGSVPALLLAWGLAGGVSAVLSMAFERLRPRFRQTIRWLVDMRDLSLPFVGEILLPLLANQGLAFVLVAFAGLEAVGAYRSAQVLFSPLAVVLQAAPLVGIPEGVRLLRRYPEHFRSVIIGVGVALTVAVAGWCTLVVLLPDSIGERLLGDSWGPASDLLLQTALFYLAAAAGLAALTGLRALAAAKLSFVARTIGGIAGLALGTIGAAVQGASGAVLGLAVGAVIGAALLWMSFVRRAGSVSTTPPATPTESSPWDSPDALP